MTIYTKWYKTGKIIQVCQFDQTAVQVLGSVQITIYNRKFLSKLILVYPRLLELKIIRDLET